MTTFIFILSHKKQRFDNDAIVELSVNIKGGVG